MKAPHKSIKWSLTKGETMGEFWRRTQSGGARKPLRSLKELAEEFGLKPMALKGHMEMDIEGPRPKYCTGGNATPRNAWYDPDQVRKWWKVKKQ